MTVAALPNKVIICGRVNKYGAVKRTAIIAEQFPGKVVDVVVIAHTFFRDRELFLHRIKNLFCYNAFDADKCKMPKVIFK